MFDILIRNAFILDGTGGPGFHGDVAVEKGKIAAVLPKVNAPAVKVIDAEGLTLAPGFIDAHSHSDLAVEKYPQLIAAVEQGITTQIAGMCGDSAAPISPEHIEDGLRVIHTLVDEELPSPVENRYSFAEYLNVVDKPLGTNMAFLVGHCMLRAAAMGFEDRQPTAEEMGKMKAMLEEAMAGGAYGISFGLIYPPGSYCDTAEMIELCKVVAAQGGIMTVHMRSEGAKLVEALEEMLTVVRQTGVRCVISHHKATGGKANWGKTKQTLEMIEQINAEGFDVYCDQYPYTASATGLNTNIPGKLHALGHQKLMEMLASKEGRDYLRPMILGEKTAEERFEYTMIGSSPSHPEYNGRMLNEIAHQQGIDPFELHCNVLYEDNLYTGGIFHSMCDEDVVRVMQYPRTMVGTDGLWTPGTPGSHPRAIATFPRVLGRYVREKGVVPLTEAIRKITSMPARFYGLKNKGIVAAGSDADLVLFNANTIKDNATYTDFRAHCTGLEYVIVGGKIAAENAVATGELGGKVLRKTL